MLSLEWMQMFWNSAGSFTQLEAVLQFATPNDIVVAHWSSRSCLSEFKLLSGGIFCTISA